MREAPRVGRAERHRVHRRDRQDHRAQRVRGGADVSREGVQRDLLPLIEGTTVTTKHGPVKTDHILFIARARSTSPSRPTCCPSCRAACRSGSSLASLNQEDFRRILTEPEASLVKQYKALLATEKVELEFSRRRDRRAGASSSAEINEAVENIGARRLHTVMEQLLEEISFTASDSPGRKVEIDAAYVREQVGALAKNADLSKFVL